MTTTRLDTQQAAMMVSSLDWLLANLDLFYPLRSTSSVDVERIKPFAELAFLCGIFAQRGRQTDSRLTHILDFVDDTARQPALRDRLIRQPATFLLYGTIYAALERSGRPCPPERHAIQTLIDNGYLATMELVPFRRMDLVYTLSSAPYRHPLPPLSVLYKDTLIYKLPSPLHVSTSDVYGITHAIFYLSDFGRVDVRTIMGDRFEATCRLLTWLLGIYTRASNWDIVGELLICCHCLRCKAEPLFGVSWNALINAQTSAGDVTGPYFDPRSSRLRKAHTAIQYRFAENYHTTLVATAACLLEIASRGIDHEDTEA